MQTAERARAPQAALEAGAAEGWSTPEAARSAQRAGWEKGRCWLPLGKRGGKSHFSDMLFI